MFNIDWASRVKNKTFWSTFIPAGLLLIQVVLRAFGIEFATEGIEKNLLDIVNALFGVLAILGIVTSHDTPGWGDYELEESK